MKDIIIHIVIIFYDFIWKLLPLITPILSPNNGLKKWLKLHNQVNKGRIETNSSPMILFACSSVGEYKRIETIAHQFAQKGYSIEISFFSPSGYSFIHSKEHNWDRISLLPIDRRKNVSAFLNTRSLSYVIVSSNMIWPNFIKALDKRKIKFSIVGCSYNSDSFFHDLSLKFRLSVIRNAEFAFCIDDNCATLLSNYLTTDQIIVSGDPRLDSILKEKNNATDLSLLTQFKKDQKLIIVGSAYEQEVNIIIRSLDLLQKNNYKVMIAPHSLDQIEDITTQLISNGILFDLYAEGTKGQNILIIDVMGILKSAYGLAEIAFIGGGWSSGIHNIAEAIIYNCSIVVGPKYSKFPEATFLANRGTLTAISKSGNLETIIANEQSEIFIKKKILSYQEWIQLNKNASKTILETLNARL